jgi:uncharacterized protein YjiS (DUF1127 family)
MQMDMISAGMTDIRRQDVVRLLLTADTMPTKVRVKGVVQEWISRARSRREIAKLDERTVRDLGISPSQLQFEARKPFWRR